MTTTCIVPPTELTTATEYILAPPDETASPLTIVRAYGPARKAGIAYLEANHYMQSSGGSGQLFIVEDRSGAVYGACLIGPAASRDAERAIAGEGVLIRQIKRVHLLDGVPMFESHVLRHAMRAVCDEYDRPVLFVSYADSAATDERTGKPLLGWTYLASGFFFAGETTGQRRCVVEHLGRAHSTRQGKVTLTRKTLPKAGDTFHGELITKDWQLKRLPPARVWLALVTPQRYTRRQAKHAWRACWSQINPKRQIAAKIWIDHVAWQRKLAEGTVSLGEPRPQHLREFDRFQPAWCDGAELTRTAAPVWVPVCWQHELLLEADVVGETTANRRYKPLCE